MSLNGQQMLAAVLLGSGARRNAEHHLHAGAVNIGIQQADSRALRSEGQREIHRSGRLADTALARGHGNNIADVGHGRRGFTALMRGNAPAYRYRTLQALLGEPGLQKILVLLLLTTCRKPQHHFAGTLLHRPHVGQLRQRGTQTGQHCCQQTFAYRLFCVHSLLLNRRACNTNPKSRNKAASIRRHLSAHNGPTDAPWRQKRYSIAPHTGTRHHHAMREAEFITL